MNKKLREKLFKIAERLHIEGDSSHDFEHVKRVTNLAVKISNSIKGDLEIVIPAALFHDIIVYKKNSLQSKNESDESAIVASEVLKSISEYPKDKIEKVLICIKECSFIKNITPKFIESKILQDADRLEATGAISIMRTFASIGHMNLPLYPKNDPLCQEKVINFRSGIDFFYARLLVVEKILHTDYAKSSARSRTVFLENFLKQFKEELIDADII